MIGKIANMSPRYGDYVDSEYDNEADFTIVMMVSGTADDIDYEGDDNGDGVGVAVTAAAPLGSFTTVCQTLILLLGSPNWVSYSVLGFILLIG